MKDGKEKLGDTAAIEALNDASEVTAEVEKKDEVPEDLKLKAVQDIYSAKTLSMRSSLKTIDDEINKLEISLNKSNAELASLKEDRTRLQGAYEALVGLGIDIGWIKKH